MKIIIDKTYDLHHCEDCAGSYADGADIWIDGKLVKKLEPIAHCYGGSDYSEQDMFKAVCEALGHTLEIK